MTMPARVADSVRATRTRERYFIARIVNPSAAALQTGQALCGVNQFDESRFVRGERLADRCGREPARERGPAVNVGRPNPLGGITNAVAEQQSELGDRGGKWQMPHASTGTYRLFDQRAHLALGLLVARLHGQPIPAVVHQARAT